jgi:hypothetical protein
MKLDLYAIHLLLVLNGHQFHQYQQMYNRLSSQLNSLNTKRTTTYDVGNPGPTPSLTQATEGGGLNRLMGSQPSRF